MNSPESMPVVHPQVLELLPKLATLEAALLSGDPLMSNHLKEIHKHLIQFEEIAHLLTEEQIAVILDGQQRKVGIILAEETSKQKTKADNKKLKNITADEL